MMLHTCVYGVFLHNGQYCAKRKTTPAMTEYKWPTDLDFLVLKINTQDMTDYAGLFNDSADIQLTLK